MAAETRKYVEALGAALEALAENWRRASDVIRSMERSSGR